MLPAYPRRNVLLGAAALGAGLAVRAARAQRSGRPAVTVRPGPGFADDAVRAAVAALPRTGGADLVFTPGRYVFSAAPGTKLLFEGIESLAVEGNGAELAFAGNDTPILFRGCVAPSVRNLVLGWPSTPFTQGVLAAVRDNGHTLDVLLAPDFPLRGDEKLGALTEVDGRSGLMGAGAADIYGGLTLTGIAGNRATVSSTQPIPAQPGATLILRHQLYGANALHFTGCTGGLEVAGVTVSAAPGMALYARSCQGDLRFTGFTVRPRAGAARLMSTNADALHLDGCSGTATVTQSSFEGMGDDAINVHSGYLRVAGPVDRRSISVESRGAVAADALPRPGASLALASGRTLAPLGTATLVSAQTGAPARLLFDADLPAGLAAGDLVADPSRRVSLAVSDCAFPGNRGRGVVAHGSVTVERCRFNSQSRAAVLLAPDTFWLECCEVSRATVRDNTVADSCRSVPGSMRFPAAVEVAALIHPQNARDNGAPALVNHDVAIEGNHILGPHGSALAVGATRGLRITGNTIRDPGGGGAVRLDRVEGAVLSGNTCSPASTVELRGTPAAAVSAMGNTGLAVR